MSTSTVESPNNEQSPTPDTTAAQPEMPSLNKTELQEAIRNQIEFYFSPNNLPTDSFLLSNMDEDQFVPLTVIANFKKIKALTSDQETIIEALLDSKYLELSTDKSKLRAKEEKRRNRIILHTLPQETTEEDIKELFLKGKCTPTEINPDVNNCWFISFESAEEATTALEFIREQKIQDKKIRARLKPEATLRMIYTTPTSFIPQTPVVYPPYPVYWNNDFNYNFEGKEPYNRRSNPRKGNRKDNRKGYDGKKRQGMNRKKGRDTKKQPPLGPSDFPPLPSATTSKNTGYSKDFTKYSHAELAESLKKLDTVKPSDLEDGFPVLSEPIKGIESETPVPIEVGDMPARAAPVPLSERVKKSPPASAPSASAGKKSKAAADTKSRKSKSTAQPKPVKTNQGAPKGAWSQIAKAGDQKVTSETKAASPTEKPKPSN